MLISVQGIYRNGAVELVEQPTNVQNDARVIVTFLAPGRVDLRSRDIGESEASELRAQLATFAEDWDSPEMDIYDDYDASKTRL